MWHQGCRAEQASSFVAEPSIERKFSVALLVDLLSATTLDYRAPDPIEQCTPGVAVLNQPNRCCRDAERSSNLWRTETGVELRYYDVLYLVCRELSAPI